MPILYYSLFINDLKLSRAIDMIFEIDTGNIINSNKTCAFPATISWNVCCETRIKNLCIYSNYYWICILQCVWWTPACVSHITFLKSLIQYSLLAATSAVRLWADWAVSAVRELRSDPSIHDLSIVTLLPWLVLIQNIKLGGRQQRSWISTVYHHLSLIYTFCSHLIYVPHKYNLNDIKNILKSDSIPLHRYKHQLWWTGVFAQQSSVTFPISSLHVDWLSLLIGPEHVSIQPITG